MRGGQLLSDLPRHLTPGRPPLVLDEPLRQPPEAPHPPLVARCTDARSCGDAPSADPAKWEPGRSSPVRISLCPAILHRKDELVRLRHSFRLDPTPSRRIAPARAFGCARVVFNDASRYAGRRTPEGCRSSATVSCPSGSSRRPNRLPNAPGWARCPRWCCSRHWPTPARPTATSSPA
ncbi:helix-turn-helix domain-containing protein [Nonomuraea montanisoli]|uniref:helix-turn-helix domain-containing protein n=1 Tax=Nonomuraea montanisoli TaxID=2741721 RepID=UPI0038B36199